jgi:hypothetical protein
VDSPVFPWSSMAPLIGKLSNRQFGGKLDNLITRLEATHDGSLGSETNGDPRLCRCTCGQAVTGSRKFVNQDHYSSWLRAQRYVGRHLRP